MECASRPYIAPHLMSQISLLLSQVMIVVEDFTLTLYMHGTHSIIVW